MRLEKDGFLRPVWEVSHAPKVFNGGTLKPSRHFLPDASGVRLRPSGPAGVIFWPGSAPVSGKQRAMISEEIQLYCF